MKPSILIIGASPAGLQAALDLAKAGIEVLLAEISPFIGENPPFKHPEFIFNTLALEAVKQPRIHLLTRTELESVEKKRDAFKVQLCMRPRYVDLNRCTGCGDCFEVCPVQVPGIEHKAIYLRDGHR